MTVFFALFLILLIGSTAYAAGRLHGQLSYRHGYRWGYRAGYLDADRLSWNRWEPWRQRSWAGPPRRGKHWAPGTEHTVDIGAELRKAG